MHGFLRSASFTECSQALERAAHGRGEVPLEVFKVQVDNALRDVVQCWDSVSQADGWSHRSWKSFPVQLSLIL